MKIDGSHICQILGIGIMFTVFVVVIISEDIFSHPFDIPTIIGLLIAVVTRPSFWIGLLFEEWGRRKRKVKK